MKPKRLGLSVSSWGRTLGYQGTDDTVSVTVRRYEAANGREIPPWIAPLALMYDRYGVPADFSKLYRMSRRSGSGSPAKDMRKHRNLRRFPLIVDHEVIHYERDAL